MNAQPSSAARRAPPGVIASLIGGFELVGRNLWLIGWSVWLDLLLWLGPRLSPAPLLQRLIAFMAAQPVPDPETARQVEEAIRLMTRFSQQANLLSLLSALPLLNPPSLLAWRGVEATSPLGAPPVYPLAGVLGALGLGIATILLGLIVGFLYFNGLAGRVRALPAEKTVEGALRPYSGPVAFVSMMLFAAGLWIGLAVLLPLWSVVVGLIVAVIPLLGFLIWAVSLGLGFYILLHLLFVVPGLLVGGRGLFRATWESVVLFQTQFPAVMGLLLVVVVIDRGLGFVWGLPADDSWLLLIGILGHACVAAGLTAGLFVFYRERIGLLPRPGSKS